MAGCGRGKGRSSVKDNSRFLAQMTGYTKMQLARKQEEERTNKGACILPQYSPGEGRNVSPMLRRRLPTQRSGPRSETGEKS